MEIKGVEAELSKETKIYNYNFAKNNDELTRRQNDLDVFQFILTFTRCKAWGKSLVDTLRGNT